MDDSAKIEEPAHISRNTEENKAEMEGLVKDLAAKAVDDFSKKINELDDNYELFREGHRIMNIQVKVIAEIGNPYNKSERLTLVGKAASLK